MKVHGNAWRSGFVSNTFVFMGCIEWKLYILRFLRWMGPSGPRVLKFDGAFGLEGCGSGQGPQFRKRGSEMVVSP